MTHFHIVYAHPADRGFTHDVLDAFVRGLDSAGHTHTLSDLYAMGFRAELTAAEYERESGKRPDAPIPDDVAAEHARLEAAGVWVFVYPVWWADCPAILKGWFDRVWTVGTAYKPVTLRVAEQALALCTAGYTVAELEVSGVYQAMRTTMLTDRIGVRAKRSELVVCNGSGEHRAGHLARVTEIAVSAGFR